MKTFISIVIICIGAFVSDSFSFSKTTDTDHGGRCTGSAYCTACSNCSRCGHCSGGGTCGVCGGGSSGNKSSSHRSFPKKSKAKKSRESDSYISKKGKSNKAPSVFVNEININSGRYIAGISVTNVYEKPSLTSRIIEKVPKNSKLIQLSTQAPWYKIKIQKSGKTGYVYYKDVK